jgi:hypothetical protein
LTSPWCRCDGLVMRGGAAPRRRLRMRFPI